MSGWYKVTLKGLAGQSYMTNESTTILVGTYLRFHKHPAIASQEWSRANVHICLKRENPPIHSPSDREGSLMSDNAWGKGWKLRGRGNVMTGTPGSPAPWLGACTRYNVAFWRSNLETAHILPIASQNHCWLYGDTLKISIVPKCQRVPKSEGYLKLEFSGSQKGGDKGGCEEERSGGRVNTAWKGKEGGKMREKWVGGKGPRKTLILVPLWFRYSLVAFQVSRTYQPPQSLLNWSKVSDSLSEGVQKVSLKATSCESLLFSAFPLLPPALSPSDACRPLFSWVSRNGRPSCCQGTQFSNTTTRYEYWEVLSCYTFVGQPLGFLHAFFPPKLLF